MPFVTQDMTRFALTGTPMENNTLELWALCSIVCPGLFGAPEQFREDYQKPIEQAGDREALQRLRSRIRPFLLRRTKELIAKFASQITEADIREMLG